MNKLFALLITSLFLTNCTSVKKFNNQREQSILVDKLQEDINFVQHKLIKLHPNYDLYISKEKLNYKFDSIRKVVVKPMTQKEFYFVISPVVAAVKQGHMSMAPVYKRYTKKEQKLLKKKGEGPLSQLTCEWEKR